jgi:hypothetical protein
MKNECLETIDDLVTVVGGMADAKKCVDSMIAWGGPAALAGAATGNAGIAIGAGVAGATSAYLDSPSCGDGVNSPMNQFHNWLGDLKPPTDMPEPQWSQMTA